jgi:HSP20 family protein
MKRLPALAYPFGVTRWEEDFDDLFRQFRESMGEEPSSLLCPSVDVSETDARIQVTVELPGIDRKDVSVEVKDGVLTIRGEKRQEEETKKGKALRIERRYGSFLRALTLPESVDASKIDAAFRNGVLTVIVPKREAKKPRAIEIHE